jgi:hypothetical protein
MAGVTGGAGLLPMLIATPIGPFAPAGASSQVIRIYLYYFPNHARNQ